MAAIWIILAKTRFPASLIQTSKEKGLDQVDFFFDLAGDFLPEYLRRTGERVGKLGFLDKNMRSRFQMVRFLSRWQGLT